MIFFTLNLKNTRYISICSAEILTSTAAIHPCRASSIQLSASKLVVLLSNLLDNSIEACRRIETGRQIQCTILEKNGFFLSIRNTSPPVLITEHGIATTKLSASEHGFGLPSVCRILASLHAEYVYDYEDGWFQFTAEIPTKLEE